MRRLLTLLLILLSCSVFAQQRLLVMGEIRSAKDSLPLDEVVVICKDPQRETHSDKKGHYAILIDQKAGQTLEFRLMSYKTVRVKVEPKKGDTLFISVWMQPDFITMKEFTLSSGPDTVIGNWRFFIEDYLFLNDSQYVLLTFEKSLKNAKVMLATENKIVASTAVPCEAKELYRDYQGHINVMCKDSAFRVKIVPPAIVLLLALPYTDFCDRMLPCIDTLGGRILFSNYHRNYPAFSYFAYDPQDTSVERLHYVVDNELLGQYNWEFDYLKPKDRLYARKMEAYTGIDKRIIAATMTGFPESIYYTPLYAPMEVVHDTICIFDHYSDSLFLYDRNGKMIGASKIDYHHPKNWKEWDRRIVKDEVTGEIYAQFEKDGVYTLKKIDIRTGKIVGTFRLTDHYVKHIRIRNGEAYFIYQPFDSVQKKFLYKERIQLS